MLLSQLPKLRWPQAHFTISPWNCALQFCGTLPYVTLLQTSLQERSPQHAREGLLQTSHNMPETVFYRHPTTCQRGSSTGISALFWKIWDHTNLRFPHHALLMTCQTGAPAEGTNPQIEVLWPGSRCLPSQSYNTTSCGWQRGLCMMFWLMALVMTKDSSIINSNIIVIVALLSITSHFKTYKGLDRTFPTLPRWNI